MNPQKIFIQNRKNQRIAVLVEEVPNPVGLTFVMHGLGGNKEEPHLQVMAKVLKTHSYTTVRFDTTNTFGESDGDYSNATTTNYYEDLEDVLMWSKSQRWYQEPFCLVGHSLGALCVALFAEKYPKKVKALAPISTVISGELSLKSPQYANNDVLATWRRTGVRETPNEPKPGLIKRLKWLHMEDRLKYDLIPEASKLTMPVLMIVGDKDESTPVSHQQILFDALPNGHKEFHVIQGSSHTFHGLKYLKQLEELFENWVKSL